MLSLLSCESLPWGRSRRCYQTPARSRCQGRAAGPSPEGVALTAARTGAGSDRRDGSWLLALQPVALVLGGRDVAKRPVKASAVEPARPPAIMRPPRRRRSAGRYSGCLARLHPAEPPSAGHGEQEDCVRTIDIGGRAPLGAEALRAFVSGRPKPREALEQRTARAAESGGSWLGDDLAMAMRSLAMTRPDVNATATSPGLSVSATRARGPGRPGRRGDLITRGGTR